LTDSVSQTDEQRAMRSVVYPVFFPFQTTFA